VKLFGVHADGDDRNDKRTYPEQQKFLTGLCALVINGLRGLGLKRGVLSRTVPLGNIREPATHSAPTLYAVRHTTLLPFCMRHIPAAFPLRRLLAERHNHGR